MFNTIPIFVIHLTRFIIQFFFFNKLRNRNFVDVLTRLNNNNNYNGKYKKEERNE